MAAPDLHSFLDDLRRSYPDDLLTVPGEVPLDHTSTALVTALEQQGRRPVLLLEQVVLVAAANRGGEDRPLLKYAITDAERFSQVMLAIGGANPEDVVLLKQPRVGELDAALASLAIRESWLQRIERWVGARG